MSGKSGTVEQLEVGEDESGARLDRFLTSRYPEWSRTRLQGLVDGGGVLVNGQRVSSHLKLRLRQRVQISWPEARRSKVSEPRPIPFPILFEDDSLLVANKPAGLVVHPAGGHHDGNTLVEILAFKVMEALWLDDVRPGLVHRLDRDTSGVILIAKTPQVQTDLSKQFSNRKVKKTYQALVSGVMPRLEGSLECHLARDPRQRQRYAVSDTGRWALTKFKVVEKLNGATRVELYPFTGRTHQLRVQLASYGHHILGDHVYGDDKAKLLFPFVLRHLLHASQIQFQHPVSKEVMTVSAPLPDDFQNALKLIRLNK